MVSVAFQANKVMKDPLRCRVTEHAASADYFLKQGLWEILKVSLRALFHGPLVFIGPTTHHMVFQLPLFSLLKSVRLFSPFYITITLKCTKVCNYTEIRESLFISFTIFKTFLSGEGIFSPLGTMIMHILFIFPDPWVKKENSQLDLFTFTDHLDNGKNCQRYVTTYYLLQGVLWSQAM